MLRTVLRPVRAAAHARVLRSTLSAVDPDRPFVPKDSTTKRMEKVAPQPSSSPLAWAARMLGLHGREASFLRAATNLYTSSCHQAELHEFNTVCEVEETFSATFELTVLHVWLLLQRLRALGNEGKKLNQAVFEFMWEDYSRRVANVGVQAFMINKHVRSLEQSFFGSCVAYDEGLLGSDALLASALWRNIYGTDALVSPRALATMVAYIRREAASLDSQTAEDLARGKLVWGAPPNASLVSSAGVHLGQLAGDAAATTPDRPSSF